MNRVAFVFDGLGYGGIERIGIDYIRMCTENGYDVDVYNLNPSANAFVENLPHGVNYYSHKLSRRGCPETYSYGIQKWWWGKYAYAIVSPFLTIKQLIEKMFIQKKEYDIAIAISGHINDLSFVSKNYIKSRKKICWCHGNLISYLSICDAYSILYRKIDSIVTLSSVAEKDVYAGKKFLHDKQIVKIYNPTYILSKELDQKKIEELKTTYGNYILMIARAEEEKGHIKAIKVIKHIKEKGYHIKLLFAGDGSQLKEYMKFAVDEGVSSECVFLGNCGDVQNYIAASYVNLLTSDHEGLPTVIVEAMSFGKPCIMTNSDDGEVSENGFYCILKEINDIEGISESIITLYSDSALYEMYHERSLKRAKDFDPKRIEKQLIQLFET